MLKQVLLVGAVVMSFPALSQTASTGAGADTTVPPSTEVIDAKPAPSGADATSDQVMQIVDREFPIYDAGSSGDLSEAEFATWMTKLRIANDPSADPETEQMKNWIGQALQRSRP